MTLRVGVVVGRKSETEGGWWTVTTALSGALRNARTRNEYVFLDEMLGPAASVSNGRNSHIFNRVLHRAYRKAARTARKLLSERAGREESGTYVDRITTAFEQKKLDAVWFMTPPGVPLAVPFIATVWDLEHRKQPYFPEVSWSWEERERSYMTVLPRASFIVTGTQIGKDEIVHYYRVNPENVKVIASPLPAKDMEQTSL